MHFNGPPGIGKSTLARRYIAEHPLAFCLDIDGIRRLIGGWDVHGQESGLLARRMALGMMQEHLSAGHDVVVPQYVARPEFIGRMKEVAAEAGAFFVEIVLIGGLAEARARFEARADDPLWADHHRETAEQIGKSGGFEGMYGTLMATLDRLPNAIAVATTEGDAAAAYADVMTVLQRVSGG